MRLDEQFQPFFYPLLQLRRGGHPMIFLYSLLRELDSQARAVSCSSSICFALLGTPTIQQAPRSELRFTSESLEFSWICFAMSNNRHHKYSTKYEQHPGKLPMLRWRSGGFIRAPVGWQDNLPPRRVRPIRPRSLSKVPIYIYIIRRS